MRRWLALLSLPLDLKSDGNKYPPALDPVKDLNLKDAELVETYYKWKLAREIKKHKKDLKDLEFQMSDEALLQMPAFQGRVRVNEKFTVLDLVNYKDRNNTLQKTEVTEKCSCPFCYMQCGSFKVGNYYNASFYHNVNEE